MAPTETEIRQAVNEALADSSIEISSWVFAMSAPMRYADPSQRGPSYEDGLWADLRPSQASRLEELLEGVYDRVQALEADVCRKIEDAIVEAALTFAAEYPDAPRSKVAVTAG